MDELNATQAAPSDGAVQPEEKKPSPTDLATLWLTRITAAQETMKDWVRRGRKITRIYRAVATMGQSNTDSTSEPARFNIFWSNVETLGPATYSRKPKVEVFRRYYDEDPVGRLAGQILERSLQYEIDCKQDLHQSIKLVLKDRLLPGLGQAWVRYEPSFKKETQLLPPPGDDEGQPTEQTFDVLADEFSPVDYVYWEDFLVGPCRIWEDAPWIGRQLLFSKERLIKRFGDSMKKMGGDINSVPVNLDPSALDDDRSKSNQVRGEDSATKMAAVFEIWDKDEKRLIWVAKGASVPLDYVTDKLEFDDFWPTPKPLLATQTNDQFLPVADYIYYQNQIRELDDVTARIGSLVDSLRLVGVYDATQESLKTLLSGGMEMKMVPVNNWAAFADKGGLKSSVDFLPLDMVATILGELYNAREQLKQSVYEITGMADIVRGASVASETLGAQQIKAKFANLRLSSRQQQMAEFVTGLLRLKAELMCNHYSPETLLRISSCDQIPDVTTALKQATEAQQQQMQQMQQAPQPPQDPSQPPAPQAPQAPPQPPPPPPQINELPIVQAALKLLKDEKTRKYRIEVAADSMIELDEADEQSRREQFMSAVANFFNGAKNISGLAPELMPVALEMLKFVVRGYRVGRSLEATIEDAVEKIKQRLAAPPPPPPIDPHVEAVQIETQSDQQIADKNNQTKLQIEGMKAQNEQASQANEDARSQAEMQFDQSRQLTEMAGKQQEQQQAQAQEGAAHQALEQIAQILKDALSAA